MTDHEPPRVVGRQPNGSLLLSNASVLTTREVEILEGMWLGRSNPQIAAELFLSVHTIEYYATRIYQKLGVANRTQAAILAGSLNFAVEDLGAPQPASRELQDAMSSAQSETSARSKGPGRKLVTLLGAGLGSTVLTVVAAIGLLAGVLPGSPISNNAMVGAKEQHCVAQPDYMIPAGGQPVALPPKSVVCFETFDEAIQSLDLDPNDYRPQR